MKLRHAAALALPGNYLFVKIPYPLITATLNELFRNWVC